MCNARHASTLLALLLLLLITLVGCPVFQSAGLVAPDTPVGLVVGNPTTSTLDLSWNNSSGATSYQVYRSSSSSGPWVKIVYNGSEIGFSDIGLSSGITYYYAVKATNSAGSSLLSSAVSVTTTVAVTFTVTYNGNGATG